MQKNYVPADERGNPDQDFIDRNHLSYLGSSNGKAVYAGSSGEKYYFPPDYGGDDSSDDSGGSTVTNNGDDKYDWMSVVSDYVTSTDTLNKGGGGAGYKGYGARGNNWGPSPGANNNYGKGDYTNANNDYGGSYTDPKRDYSGGFTNPDQSGGYADSGQKYGAGSYANSGQMYGVGVGANSVIAPQGLIPTSSPNRYGDHGQQNRNSKSGDILANGVLNKNQTKKQKLATRNKNNIAKRYQSVIANGVTDNGYKYIGPVNLNLAVLPGAVGTYSSGNTLYPEDVGTKTSVLDSFDNSRFSKKYMHVRVSAIDKLRNNSHQIGEGLAMVEYDRYAPIDDSVDLRLTAGLKVGYKDFEIGTDTKGKVSATYRGIGVEYSIEDNSGSIILHSLKLSADAVELFEPFIGFSKVMNERLEYIDITLHGKTHLIPYITWEVIEATTFLGKKVENRIIFDISGNVLNDSYRDIYTANAEKKIGKSGKKGLGVGVDVKVESVGYWQKTPEEMKKYRDNNYYKNKPYYEKP